MKTIVKVIDAISENTGKVSKWSIAIMIAVLVYEVIARYSFNSPTIWAHELTTILLLVAVSLGWGYVHKYNGHIRVDVVYNLLTPRKQALVDFVCYLVLFFPVVISLLISSWVRMVHSWAIGEIMTTSYWYPPAGPIRTAVFIGLLVLALQGIAQLVRTSHLLFKGKKYGA